MIRFSIRSLLAIILLCGLIFPLAIGVYQVRRNELVRAQLHAEIAYLQIFLVSDDLKQNGVWKHQEDEFASLRELREIAEKNFSDIQNRYGKIQPRGPGVVSLRTIPQLSIGSVPAPTVFRLLVPASREVWLKYAVVLRDGPDLASPKLDELVQPLTDTGFQRNGLYEVRIAPGQRFIEVHTGPVTGHDLPIAIKLDDKTLLDTGFTGDGVPSSGAHHISGRKQIDFDAKHDLPWLFSVDIKIQRDGSTRQDARHVACLWLSDRASGFDGFPGQGNDR